MNAALAGIRVVDLASGIATGMAAMLSANFGAEVVKMPADGRAHDPRT